MINKAILVGRLGAEPEIKAAQSGKTVCRFRLATDTGFGQNKKTDWHSIVCFDRQADFVRNYLHKGSLVYVEGRISYGQYEKDGVTRYTTDIIANTVQSLGKNEGQSMGAGNFDPNMYDTPAYNSAPSYNSAPTYSAPAPSAPAPEPDAFGGEGITNDEIPF